MAEALGLGDSQLEGAKDNRDRLSLAALRRLADYFCFDHTWTEFRTGTGLDFAKRYNERNWYKLKPSASEADSVKSPGLFSSSDATLAPGSLISSAISGTDTLGAGVPSSRPRTFIVASPGTFQMAQAVQINLRDAVDCTVWSQTVFNLNESIINELRYHLSDTQFGIFLLSQEHLSGIKNDPIIRDCFLFEVGLFSGKFGPERTFIVIPASGISALPSSFPGITIATYNQDTSDYSAATNPVCYLIKQRASKLGLTRSAVAHPIDEGQYVAAICFRKRGTGPEFLLVKSTRGRHIFPKGRLKIGDLLELAALRYAQTEGGVIGSVVSKKYVVFRYFKEEIPSEHLVTALLVDVSSTVRSRASFRDPEWFNIEAAERALSEEREFQYAEELRKVLRWCYAQVQIRTSKQNKVGVVPFRKIKSDVQILLITSRTHHRWILPKGNTISGIPSSSCAAEEALQEAGVEGELLGEPLGFYEYTHQGVPHRVEMFVMEVKKMHSDWPEKTIRERKWFSINQAETVVEYEHIKQILVEFQRRLVV